MIMMEQMEDIEIKKWQDGVYARHPPGRRRANSERQGSQSWLVHLLFVFPLQ
jgi:hypothetical protein